MKIVILDGFAVNPGDLSWDVLNQFGEVTVYNRTPEDLVIERIGDAEIIVTKISTVTARSKIFVSKLSLLVLTAPVMKYISSVTSKSIVITGSNRR